MRQQAIGQKALVFGEGSASLYRIGRSKELLGARVGRTIASQSISASLDRPEWFANVRRSSPYIPSRISGWIDRGVMPSSVELAIAVNGRVRALTRVFRDGRRQRFRALVPPSTLVEGGNRIDVYAIRLDRTTRLAWLGSS